MHRNRVMQAIDKSRALQVATDKGLCASLPAGSGREQGIERTEAMTTRRRWDQTFLLVSVR